MNARFSRFSFIPVALGVLAAIGCGGVEIKPENPNVAVPRAEESSGLKAALVSEGSTAQGDFMVWDGRFAQVARNSIAPSVPLKLADAVRRTGAFESVETGSPGSPADVVLAARSELKFTADETWPVKSFLIGFTLFLGSPFITFDDRYDASGNMTVTDSDERVLARYAETYRVEMTHWMILPGQADPMLQDGADAAIAGLAAKFAGDLVRDLDKLTRKDSAPRRRHSRPHEPAEPVAESAPAPAPAPPAAPVAAVPAPPPAPPPADSPEPSVSISETDQRLAP